MIKMQSPKANRKGIYEVHDVPDRKIELYKSWGWKVYEDKSFDINREWFKVRQEVKDLLDLDKYPKSKKHACELLEDAGYKIK